MMNGKLVMCDLTVIESCILTLSSGSQFPDLLNCYGMLPGEVNIGKKYH